MKSLHYLQHVPFETPGSIVEWARDNSIRISSTRFDLPHDLPDPDSIDCLVVMGGPMGVCDEAEFPWLNAEKRFIENTIKAGKAVLGVCLGAQLLAAVLGSKVSKNKSKEIGWHSVRTTEENKSIPLTGFLPDEFTAFHWHGDTFELPSGSKRIAASEACDNQGFVYGDRVIGLQFHLEVTRQSIGEMARNGKKELAPARFVQDEQTIMVQSDFTRANNRFMSEILTNLGKVV